MSLKVFLPIKLLCLPFSADAIYAAEHSPIPVRDIDAVERSLEPLSLSDELRIMIDSVLPIQLNNHEFDEEKSVVNIAHLLSSGREYFYINGRYTPENTEYYFNQIEASRGLKFSTNVMGHVIEKWNGRIEYSPLQTKRMVNHIAMLSFQRGELNALLGMLVIYFFEAKKKFTGDEDLSDIVSLVNDLKPYAPELRRKLLGWVAAYRLDYLAAAQSGSIIDDEKELNTLHHIFVKWIVENAPTDDVAPAGSVLSQSQMIIEKHLNGEELKDLETLKHFASTRKDSVDESNRNLTHVFAELFRGYLHLGATQATLDPWHRDDALTELFEKQIAQIYPHVSYEIILKKLAYFTRSNMRERSELTPDLKRFKDYFVGVITHTVSAEDITFPFVSTVAKTLVAEIPGSESKNTVIEETFKLLCLNPETSSDKREVKSILDGFREKYPSEYFLAEFLYQKKHGIIRRIYASDTAEKTHIGAYAKSANLIHIGTIPNYGVAAKPTLTIEEMISKIHDILFEMYKLPTNDFKKKKALKAQLLELELLNSSIYSDAFEAARISAEASIQELKSADAAAREETPEETMARLGLLEKPKTHEPKSDKPAKKKKVPTATPDVPVPASVQTISIETTSIDTEKEIAERAKKEREAYLQMQRQEAAALDAAAAEEAKIRRDEKHAAHKAKRKIQKGEKAEALKAKRLENIKLFCPFSYSYTEPGNESIDFTIEMSPNGKDVYLTVTPCSGSPEFFPIPVESLLEDGNFITFLMGIQYFLGQRMDGLMGDKKMKQDYYNQTVMLILQNLKETIS